MIDCNSAIPLYEQVYGELKADIQRGAFNATRRLPTEEELAEQYQVSRITVRRAVSELVKEGLVEKKQGKGTFVRSPKMHKDMMHSGLSFTELCAMNGKTPSTKLLAAGIERPGDAKTIEWLGLQPGEDAVRIKRLRYMDGVPCVIEDNYFPKKYSYLLGIDLEHDSLYRYLREEKGYDIVSGDMVLRIVRPSTKIAKLLGVSRSTPLLSSCGRLFRGDGEILHTCRQIGYGEDFEFIIR
ncbi:MAG: GntR family transcriptional regulator [Lachnospiraceae bacterium]|nr:GntR family transcriptional regulator [Lachnospiraceae bacterium]